MIIRRLDCLKLPLQYIASDSTRFTPTSRSTALSQNNNKSQMFSLSSLPFTISSAEVVAVPFSFVAVHLYSPSSSALVSEIFSVTRSPLVRKSNLPPFLILSPSTNHSMSGTGSPSTRHRSLAGSPTQTSTSSSSSVNFGWAAGQSSIC